MLTRLFTNDNVTPVDSLIDAVLEEMHAKGVYSDDYPDLMRKLEKLYKLKTKDRRPTVSPDTLALIAGNLLGILVIVAYEQKHVMTSKAMTQIIRPKTQ
jgi:hypothetical protein